MRGEERTRLWLVGICAVAVMGVGVMSVFQRVDAQPRAARGDYVSHNTCKLCHNQTKHGSQWDTWEASPHARAHENLKSEDSLRIAREMGLDEPPHEAAACLRCHATAYDAARGVPEPLRIADGVQCESCHGAGGEHVVDGRRYWVEGDASVDTLAHILRPNERTCVACHRRQSPTWDPERYVLPDGRTTGFDFQQAFARIAHPLVTGFAEE